MWAAQRRNTWVIRITIRYGLLCPNDGHTRRQRSGTQLVHRRLRVTPYAMVYSLTARSSPQLNPENNVFWNCDCSKSLTRIDRSIHFPIHVFALHFTWFKAIHGGSFSVDSTHPDCKYSNRDVTLLWIIDTESCIRRLVTLRHDNAVTKTWATDNRMRQEFRWAKPSCDCCRPTWIRSVNTDCAGRSSRQRSQLFFVSKLTSCLIGQLSGPVGTVSYQTV